MLSFVEIFLVCFFVAVVSIVEVLSARFYLRDFPWYEILFKSHFFGGKAFLTKRLLMLAAWLSASIIFALGFALLVKSTQQYFLGADGRAESSLQYFISALPLLTSVLAYLCVCQLMRRYAGKLPLTEKIPGFSFGQKGMGFVGRKTNFPLALLAFRRLTYRVAAAIPHVFLGLYRYFYFDAGRLVNGACNVLVSEYGPETIVRFFEHQQATALPKEESISLNHLDGHYENSVDWAQYLLAANIRQKGLYDVKRAIKQYLKLRQSVDVSKREAERIRCKNPVKIMIRSKGLVGYAKLLEYSEGYRGFYITTNLDIDQRERINITIDDTEYTTKVVHQNCFIAKERIFSGYGLSLAS